MSFTKAVKHRLPAKILVEGFSGSGKTYSSLLLAQGLCGDARIAVIDTENKRSRMYADKFDFDDIQLAQGDTSPEKYIDAINMAEDAGYGVLIIDSITHEWSYLLNIIDNIQGNSFAAWKKVTPRHDKFMQAIVNSNIHIISTMRSKAAYDVSENGRKVEKVGTKGIQREGQEYEYMVVFNLNQRHMAFPSKDNTGLFDGKDFVITKETGHEILKWVNSGKSYDRNYVIENGVHIGKKLCDIDDVTYLTSLAIAKKTPEDLKCVLRKLLNDIHGSDIDKSEKQ
jgi:hypothetical protein